MVQLIQRALPHVDSYVPMDFGRRENFLYMVVPVVKALRIFDGTAPAMGLAWKVMYDLEDHVRRFIQPPFGLSPDLASIAMIAFKARWNLMITDLHWAGAMLNPRLRGWAPLHENELARPILNRVFRRLIPSNDTYIEVLDQYQDFLENRGPFADSTDPNIHNVPLHEWWDAMGGGAKALQIIARRILGQVCSASACERNWSMYSYVHNKVRNRLKHERAEDLVYIYTNSRLLRHRRGPRPAQWYGLNAIHSDDESDGDDHRDAVGDEGGDNIVDDINMDDGDFNLDDLDIDGPDSDGDDSDHGIGGNMGVFDFDDVELAEEHVPQSPQQDPSINGPSFGQLCSGQGLWVQEDVQIPSNHRENIILSTQAQSDSLSFGVEGEGVHTEEPISMYQPTIDVPGARSHTVPVLGTTNSSSINPTTGIHMMPTIPNTESLPDIGIPNEDATPLQIPPPIVSHTRPLTRSAVSANRIGTRSVRGVGATLVSLQSALPNAGRGRTRRPPYRLPTTSNANSINDVSLSTPPRPSILPRGIASVQTDAIERATSHNAPVIIGVRRGRGQAATNIYGVPLPTNIGDVATSSRANGIGRRRTTRGVKRARYQGRPIRFVGEDYDPSDGRPNLDENGLCDVEGSRPTRRLVVTRDERLRLRAVTPRSDDDESTDDSDEDPRCLEANDPTVRL